jgi:hypothetical protein
MIEQKAANAEKYAAKQAAMAATAPAMQATNSTQVKGNSNNG